MQNWVFLSTLDTLLQNNAVVFFFENQISKWRLFEIKGYFRRTFHCFSYQGKVTKILLAFSILKKKIRIYQVWFLFGMIPGVDSYLRYFGTINKYQNGEQNISWNVSYWYVFTLMPNL